MQVGDRVLILVDKVPGTKVEVPDQTYGEVLEIVLGEASVSMDGTPWYFSEDELEVTVDAAQ